MQDYHLVWLALHPERTADWLAERLADGFHIHHVDGNHSNNHPLNLILIDGADHLMLHAGSLEAGIKWWRKTNGRKGAAALAAKRGDLPKQERVRRRPVIKRSEPFVVLGEAELVLARTCIAEGGTVADAARVLGQTTDLTWKQRMAAVRREVIAA